MQLGFFLFLDRQNKINPSDVSIPRILKYLYRTRLFLPPSFLVLNSKHKPLLMKNATLLLRNLAVLIVLIFTLTNCNDPKEKPRSEDKIRVSAPAEIVEINQAKRMYENYTIRRVALIQRYEDSINRGRGGEKIKSEVTATKSFDVGRFVYYDYKTIKQYMDYIEQEAETAGVEISSLRLYYSNYDDETYFQGTKDSIKHPRQNSILLSPTIKKGKRDYLFYLAQGAKGPEAVILDDEFGTPEGIGLLGSEDKTSRASLVPNFFEPSAKPSYARTSLTMNRGGGIPPPYH